MRLRNGIAILITFDLAVSRAWTPRSSCGGPGPLHAALFPVLGHRRAVADKHDKAMLARWIKVSTRRHGLRRLGLWLENPYMHLTVLFLAGTTAAFFGPIKYGVLPQYLKRDELIGGNGLIELGNFRHHPARHHVRRLPRAAGLGQARSSAITIVALALPGAGLRIPDALGTGRQSIASTGNVPRQTRKLFAYARERKDVFRSVIGASWFWFLGIVILAQIPVFSATCCCRDTVANIFIGLFTVGIGAGSLLTNALLRARSRRATCRSPRS